MNSNNNAGNRFPDQIRIKIRKNVTGYAEAIENLVDVVCLHTGVVTAKAILCGECGKPYPCPTVYRAYGGRR